MKKIIGLLTAGIIAGATGQAQVLKPCGADEERQELIKKYPSIPLIEAQLEAQLQARINNGSFHALAKGTAIDYNTVYHVPVVFHVVHDYGEEYVTDNQIFETVNDMNAVFNRTNALTNPLVAPYAGNIPGTSIQYRGLSNIQFHLATKDPSGNPTRGITRTRSYFANNAGDNSKIEQWDPSKYINIWLIHTFSGSHTGAAAYAIYPSTADFTPWGDGIITIVQPSNGNGLNSSHTIAHEMGHIMNLKHVFGDTNSPQVACGDDNVDDTPPTTGHYQPSGCTAGNLYDVTCAVGYSKTYTPSAMFALYGIYSIDSPTNSNVTHSTVINYPDTVNSQNVMDYTYCSQMFTYGQATRMRVALTGTAGHRNNLITPANLLSTGVTDNSGNILPLPNLPPVADFSVNRVFVCADGQTPVNLTNRSWNDTIVSAAWVFGNGASSATSTSLTNISNLTFSTPGWVHAALTVTGNGSGSTTINKDRTIYAAEPVGVTPNGYVESFNTADTSQWPIFNYYGNNNYKWEYTNAAGYNDNTSIRFANYDPRTTYNGATQTQTPEGSYSDFFSRGFDLSANANYNLSFAYAGAWRTGTVSQMNDVLEVAYSDDCGITWVLMPDATLKQNDLGNNGNIATQFTPTTASQWAWRSGSLSGIGSDKVFFRFRYKVGTGDANSTQLGTGNNFYIDKIGVNNYPLGVSPVQLEAQGIVLVPNPTTGASTIAIKGGNNSTALVHVTDITGKVVFSTTVRLNAAATNVEIPAERIAVKGMYMVEVIANGQPMTQKLVVY